jgi:putative tryptophan/tyrosine transport system substrate-binding protein
VSYNMNPKANNNPIPTPILAHGTPATAAFQRETRTIPIVFAVVSDPVGVGFVASLPRPGGNLTGFIHTEASMGGKWLELLTEIAPGVKRATCMLEHGLCLTVRALHAVGSA